MAVLRFFRTFLIRSTMAVAVYVAAVFGITTYVQPPGAVGMHTELRDAEEVRFLADSSWLDEAGKRQLEQTIFDDVFALIEEAHQFLLIDMFLFNDWQGPSPETHRSLSSELTKALVKRKEATPDLHVVFITDPVNSIYRGLDSVHLNTLRNAGVYVVETDLIQLQDSNRYYSALWRAFIKPFGNVKAESVNNPLGIGKVSIRSVLTMANFKANHRKLILADRADGSTRAIVMSANPHDGSSAHRNVALSFTGRAALDLLFSEIALMQMSANYNGVESVTEAVVKFYELLKPDINESVKPQTQTAKIQVLSESRIREQIITTLNAAQSGAKIDLLMFYLSDRKIIKAMIAAKERGVDMRVILDVNKDAFGREKNGVPNRPVAAELHEAGIPIKWCATKGEQCHGKMLLWQGVGFDGQHGVLLGSSNYTKRNLADFNLETNVLLLAGSDYPAMSQAQQYFDEQWNDKTAGRSYSYEYREYEDASWPLKIEYRLREATGFGTF